MGNESEPVRREITDTLNALARGSDSSLGRLIPSLYAELRALAERLMARERSEHTLSATALVHEAYLRLVDQTRVEVKGRAHFLALAAQAARRVLVDHARAKACDKRGGGFQRVALTQADVAAEDEGVDVLALHEAIERLAVEEPMEASIVEMRFFGGMTEQEIAEMLGVSAPTVRRRWRFAKTWLRRQLSAGDAPPAFGG